MITRALNSGRFQHLCGLMLAGSVVYGCCTSALADGGKLIVSRRLGDYQFAVFAAPTTLRAGAVELSALVQDANGNLVPAPSVRFFVSSDSRPSEVGSFAASAEASTNKLLQTAKCELPTAGRWSIRLMVDGGLGTAELPFDLQLADSASSASALVPWFAWPVGVVIVFALHQVLAARRAAARLARITVSSA